MRIQSIPLGRYKLHFFIIHPQNFQNNTFNAIVNCMDSYDHSFDIINLPVIKMERIKTKRYPSLFLHKQLSF